MDKLMDLGRETCRATNMTMLGDQLAPLCSSATGQYAIGMAIVFVGTIVAAIFSYELMRPSKRPTMVYDSID